MTECECHFFLVHTGDCVHILVELGADDSDRDWGQSEHLAVIVFGPLVAHGLLEVGALARVCLL